MNAKIQLGYIICKLLCMKNSEILFQEFKIIKEVFVISKYELFAD